MEKIHFNLNQRVVTGYSWACLELEVNNGNVFKKNVANGKVTCLPKVMRTCGSSYIWVMLHMGHLASYKTKAWFKARLFKHLIVNSKYRLIANEVGPKMIFPLGTFLPLSSTTATYNVTRCSKKNSPIFAENGPKVVNYDDSRVTLSSCTIKTQSKVVVTLEALISKRRVTRSGPHCHKSHNLVTLATYQSSFFLSLSLSLSLFDEFEFTIKSN